MPSGTRTARAVFAVACGALVATPVACHGGTCRVTIEPYSAVMLTLP